MNVKAAPGVDQTVLSGDDILNLIESLNLMPSDGKYDLNDDPGSQGVAAVSHEPLHDVTVDTTKPKSDDDIRNLMIRAAGLPDGHLKCPKLSFAVLRQFLIQQNVAMEYLPHHGGGRFSIEMGEFSYAASATKLNPSAKDASGIVLWAKIDGYASSRNGTAS